MRFEKKLRPILKERERIDKLYGKLIKEAKERQDRDEVAYLNAEAGNEHRIIQFEIDCVVTGELTSEAQALFVPLPSRSDSEYWGDSALSGDDRKYLSDKGISFVRDAIRHERKKRYENQKENIELVLKIVTLLTGLIGACIGFASILKS